MGRYCVNVVLSWIIWFSPSVVIENFAVYSNLGFYPWSFRICKIPAKDILICRISIEM